MTPGADTDALSRLVRNLDARLDRDPREPRGPLRLALLDSRAHALAELARRGRRG